MKEHIQSMKIASAVVLAAAMGLTLLAPSVANAQSSPGFRSPSIVVGGGFGAADRKESESYGLLVTGSFRLFLTRSLAIEADVTRISDEVESGGATGPYTYEPYTYEVTEWAVAAGLVARTPPRRVSAFGSGGLFWSEGQYVGDPMGYYFGGGIDVRVAGPLLAYGQLQIMAGSDYYLLYIGGIRYVVR